jgi:hypothetical protein
MRQKFCQPLLPGILTPIQEIEIPTTSRSRLYPTLISLQEIFKRKRDVVDLVYEDLLKGYLHTTNDLIDPILEEFFGSTAKTVREHKPLKSRHGFILYSPKQKRTPCPQAYYTTVSTFKV